METKEMNTGKVKFYAGEDRGFGFIANDSGKDIFFHMKESPYFADPVKGEKVQFQITETNKGSAAKNITRL